MSDEAERLRAKLSKLEEVLEKQRWTQREQSVKYQNTVESLSRQVEKLNQEMEEVRFSESYKNDEIAAYRAVLNSLPEAIYVMYQTDEVVLFNDEAKRLGRISGLPLQEAIKGRQVKDLELIHSFPDGSTATLQTSAFPLRDGGGTIIGAIAICKAIK